MQGTRSYNNSSCKNYTGNRKGTDCMILYGRKGNQEKTYREREGK